MMRGTVHPGRVAVRSANYVSTNEAMFAAPGWLAGGRLRPASVPPDAISRPRLMACCAEKITFEHIWIALAPAGFGKTIWLAQAYSLLRGDGHPTGWLTLTPDENNPERLITSLIQAAIEARGGNQLHWTPPSNATYCEAGLAYLLNMLAALADTCLLIDNLEVLTNPKALELFDKVVAYFPAMGRLMLAGRRYNGSRFRKLATEGRIGEISAYQLRLNRSEMSALCDSLGESELCRLATLTDGWPVGVKVLSKYLEQGHPFEHEELSPPAPSLIAEYIDEQILSGFDSHSLQFLMESSVLGEFSPDMLENIPNRRYSWSNLESIIESGFYIEAQDQCQTSFGYLPVFSNHLATRLRLKDPERVKILHRFAADWLAEHNCPVQALRHAVSTGDALYAAEIGERVRAIQLGFGEGARVLNYSRFLTPADVNRFPMVVLGQVYLATEEGRFREARATLDQLRATHDIFRSTVGKAPIQLLAMADVLEHVLRTYENRPVSADEIRNLENHLNILSDDAPILRASVAVMLSSIYIRYCKFEDAAAAADIGRAALTNTEANCVSFFLRITSALAALRIGQMREANLHIERAIEIAHKLFDPKGKDMATVLTLKAQLHYEANETQAARSTINQVLEWKILPLIGWFDIYAAAFDTAVAVAADSQDFEALTDILHEAERIARVRGLAILGNLSQVLRLRETTRSGDYEGAVSLLNSGVMLTLLNPTHDNTYPSHSWVQTLAFLEAARLMILLERYRDAEGYLGKIEDQHIIIGDIRIRLTYSILKMITAFHLRRHAEACDHLRLVMSIALSTGMTRRLIEHKDQIIEVADWMKRVKRPLPGKAGVFIDDLRHKNIGCWPKMRPKIRIAHDETYTTAGLSPREIEVLTLLSDGYSSKEIAAQLSISDGTVKTHRKKINAKLGVSSRSGAMAIARKMMII